jgi:glycosyltransferase involved in cell wall biosynthesis
MRKGRDRGVVSVMMLTYNREALVGRAIESILNQTLRDFEFLIVDNGSTDRSGDIAESYAARDSRVRVLHRPRGNIGSGRNAALDAARGAYLAFVDDDDWAEPDFLEFLRDLLVENHADVAICGAADKIFDEKKVLTAEEAVVELMRRKKYNMAFPTKLFRRELVENLRFPEEGAYDDIALMYRLLAEAKRGVAYHGLPKYTFYRHEGNNSAWTTDHSLLTAATLDEYLRAYRTRTVWLSEKFPNSAGAFRYFEWSFMISMVEKITRLRIPDCQRQLAEMKAVLLENREEFLLNSNTQDFEKVWFETYILKNREDASLCQNQLLPKDWQSSLPRNAPCTASYVLTSSADR